MGRPTIETLTKRLRGFLAVPSCWMLLGVACTSTESPPATDGDGHAEELTFEVLFVGIDGTADLRGRDRFDALPEQLGQQDVDVLCLQGVGAPADRATLKVALSKVFPVSLDLPTDDNSPVNDPRDAVGRMPPDEKEPPCAGLEESLRTATACFATCEGGRQEEQAAVKSGRCIGGNNCWSKALTDADPERRCQNCMFSHLRAGEPPKSAAERCASMTRPLSSHGQHGMMLLSKHPLSRPSVYVLPSQGTRRVVLGATVTTLAGTKVDVFCTSLGPTALSALPNDAMTLVPYSGPYGSPRDGWLRENEVQIEKLATHVMAQREDRPQVIMGNFGTSTEVVRHETVVLPASGPLGAARLNELFASGIAPSFAPSCTVCANNPIVNYVEQAESFDNRIYLAGLKTTDVRSSTRSYLGAVVGPDQSAPFVKVRAPISMQYGFRSTIAIPHP